MKKALLSLSLAVFLSSQASAALWWDTNGATAGAGATPNGAWSSGGGGWTTSSTGTAATINYPANPVAADNLRFSAGTDAANPYTITITGNVNVIQLGLEEGAPITFDGGTMTFTHAAAATSILAGVTALIPTTATINSQISSAANVGFKVARNAGLANVISISNPANNWTGPTSIGLDTTLKSLAAGVVPDATVVTANGGSTFDLNGFSETIASLAGSGSVKLGAGTLTIAAPANESFNGIISGTGGIVKTGAGNWNLTVANTYTGDTTISQGGLGIDGDATLGNGAGTVKLNGGKLIITVNRSVTTDPVVNPVSIVDDSAITTNSATATVNVNFSSNSISGTAGKTVTFRNEGADGAGDLFDPRFSGAGFNLASNVVIDNGSVGLTRLSSFNTTGTDQTFSGEISGTGSYRRSASSAGTGGRTIFTGANTYSGGTTINDGTLVANNTSGSATGTGAVTINSGGTLAGSGAVGAALTGAVTVNSGGKVSPGNSIDSLAIVGDLSLGSGSTFVVEIDTTAPLTPSADLLTVGGALNITSGALISLADAITGQLLAENMKLTLMAYNTGSWNMGLFTSAMDSSEIGDDTLVTIGANSYYFNYNDSTAGVNFTGDSSSFTSFVTLTAVPEPTAFLFGGLGCGLFGLGYLRRKFMARRAAIAV